jgi:hypothetical protein
MIDETGLPADHLQIPFQEEMTMFKTISAALIAVSMIAAPALAANAKITRAPATKTMQAPAIKSTKTSVLNANAKMGRHYHKRYHHHHKIGALRTHAKVSFKHATKPHSKVSFKHSVPAVKRG